MLPGLLSCPRARLRTSQPTSLRIIIKFRCRPYSRARFTANRAPNCVTLPDSFSQADAASICRAPQVFGRATVLVRFHPTTGRCAQLPRSGPVRAPRAASCRPGSTRRYRNRRIGESSAAVARSIGGRRHRVGTKSAPSGDSAQMHGRHRDWGFDERCRTSGSNQIPKSDLEAPASSGVAEDDHSGKA